MGDVPGNQPDVETLSTFSVIVGLRKLRHIPVYTLRLVPSGVLITA